MIRDPHIGGIYPKNPSLFLCELNYIIVENLMEYLFKVKPRSLDSQEKLVEWLKLFKNFKVKRIWNDIIDGGGPKTMVFEKLKIKLV